MIDFLFAFLHTKPLSIKDSTIKGKNLHPKGTYSFILPLSTKISFQKGDKNSFV